ncbi:hypothetical protein [Tardiphaga robiniae]|uniref:hypothetical protein n=1 Tax=Tardiphaga robiniae TaxID=943830 RepID=UPI001586AE23|nr:hypothetical protein [Tardiphaga robiniae]
MKNKFDDLKDHLFAQLERLSDETLTAEQIDVEAKRGGAIVAIADRILEQASLQVQAAKVAAEFGADPEKRLPALSSEPMKATPPRLVGGSKS